MKFITIFRLYLQEVLYNKAEFFVYFLMAFVNPIAGFMFWRGAYKGSMLSSQGWSYEQIMSYYLLLIIVGAMLMAHIETSVAQDDIQKGNLVNHLLKPFPYTITKLFSEAPWRLVQGVLGILFFIVYITVFEGAYALVSDPFLVLATVIIFMLGFVLSFLLKMIVGLSAFWVVDFSGIQQTVEVMSIVLSGFVIPLSLYPHQIKQFVLLQPFAYIIYHPITAVIGRVSSDQFLPIIGMQLIWITIFFVIFSILWKNGVKRFTGVSN
jgi:ABC-2 type transport system permease protein